MAKGAHSAAGEAELPSGTGRRGVMRYLAPGVFVLAFISAISTFLVLTGLTPIMPTEAVVVWALAINGVLIASMTALIVRELWTLWIARRRRRAASGLHVRVVTLFSLVAAIPAILVAAAASVTLERGLDRWFSERTQLIIGTSLAVAQAYVREHSHALRAEILAMQTDIDRAEPYFTFDHSQFEDYFATQTKIRNLVIAVLMKADGTEVMQAKPVESEPTVLPPKEVAADANADEPVLVTPGTTNQVGAVIKLKAFDDLYLYIGRLIDPRVTQYLRITEANAAEYKALEARRYGVQVAFGLLYVGIALVMLLAAIWLGIGFANRLVAPIRRLIGAADQVSRGNLYVQVPLAAEEGDLANLSETFNNMTSQLRHQRDELLSANEQLDQRSRFTEAVLAGVTAGVIGVDHRGCTTLANRSALKMLATDERTMLGKPVVDVMPEIADILGSAFSDPNRMHVAHEVVQREGGERNIMVRVTSEESDTEDHDFVITLDDITDLVTAQRTSAWADVARRIAHEIKNPLTPIQLSAERLKRKYGKVLTTDRDVFEQCTDTIIRQVGDIGRMVDEFSSFARMPKPVMEVGDLSETVRQTVFLMRVGHPDLTIEADLPEDPMRCRFDRRLIAQALTNIIKNATEGIAAAAGEDEPVGGRIRVVGRETATHYEVDVIDNGIGLPRDNRRRLLEPYMTTREKGTGLGLAIVRKIVEDHGGTIELLDSPEVETGGRGAMVRLTVARIEAPDEAGADGAAASETNGRPERQPNGV